jgi:hypothetical protein
MRGVGCHLGREIMSLQTNPQLELAFDYVRETSTNIFLTGKAGSGKTTFLRQIKTEGGKRMAVVAPTGVAAINAGGMTIHSLFQLPLGLHVPNSHRREEPRKLSRQKLNLIRSLDLLIIDEISMVRADLLDAVDDALRRIRESDRPFGNVQLLMIGDLHQLPPVVKQEEWDTLSRYYDTPYFFGSIALKKTDYVSIELKHIYRQSDATFIELLNKVRDNRLDEDTLRTLNSRYVPDFRPPPKDAYITLTTTNAVALDINTRNLAQLPGKSHRFSAQIVGEFPASAYPTEVELEFKRGAQVMFVKNDSQPEKRYFNGKIGQIVGINDEGIVVRCEGDAHTIAVAREEWQNVKYALNEATKQIEEQVLGMFIQYPLKLAWAITIHKSQGLTFDRAIIDAQAAFAHGQVYVALSRCKSFEGIVLRTRIDYSSVKTDPVVKDYSAETERNAPTESQVQQAKREYQQQLIEDLFSFRSIEESLSRLRRLYQEHQSSLGAEASDQVSGLARQAHETLTSVADKFHPQLLVYFEDEGLPESNSALRQRIVKAACYFTEKLAGLMQVANDIPKLTDNQAVRQLVLSQFEKLLRLLFIKQASFAACSQGFSTVAYKRAQFDAELDFAQKFLSQSQTETVPKGVPHPKLYAELLQYREKMADKYGISPRSVLISESLRLLVLTLPTTQNAIRKIHGIARKRLDRYGKDIEAIIRQYCEANQISPERAPDGSQPKPELGSSTKQISLMMFQEGKTVEQIAKERGLTASTIQGHLAYYVEENQLDIHRLLDKAKLEEIEQFYSANPIATLTEAKAHFGSKFDYGELRLAISYLRKREH